MNKEPFPKRRLTGRFIPFTVRRHASLLVLLLYMGLTSYAATIFAFFLIGYTTSKVGSATTSGRLLPKSFTGTYLTNANDMTKDKDTTAKVNIIIKSVDINNSFMLLDLQVLLPQSALDQYLVLKDSIRDSFYGNSISRPATANCMADLINKSQILGIVKFEPTTGIAPLQIFDYPIMISDLKPQGYNLCQWAKLDIKMPILGMNRIYPLDWFGGRFNIWINFLNEKSKFTFYDSNNRKTLDSWDTILMVTVLPSIRDFNFFVADKLSESKWMSNFDIFIRRTHLGGYMAFIAIGMLYILSAAALYFIFMDTSYSPERIVADISTLLGLSLSILPLRAILVPTEITGITLVDLQLFVIFCYLAGGAILRCVHTIFRRSYTSNIPDSYP